MDPGSRRPVRDRLAPLPLPDLIGRRVVVSGASSGIGLATASALAGAGATVVMAVRNLAKGEVAAERIRRDSPQARLSIEQVELGSLASVAEFTTRVGTEPIDLVVSNAGLSTSDPTARTADGFDLQIGVNYLGSFALLAGLWPALRAARGARVVTLGSLMARRGRIDADFGTATGSTYRSYSDSKLAQVVLAGELRRRSTRKDAGVTSVAAHPGWSQTAIFASAGPPAAVETVGGLLGALQSPADGAQPVLLAATDPRPAAYYGSTRRLGAAGPAAPVRLPAGALEPGVGERLWARSVELTGLDFQP